MKLTKIKVKAAPDVTVAQLQDPRFLKLWQDSERGLNDKRDGARLRELISLHEAGHVIYARRLGVEPKFHPPVMMWDSRPQYNCPAISRASTSWTLPNSETADITAVLKAHIGGFVFRERLSDTPNDEIAIGSDLDGARVFYTQRVGGTGEDFQKAIAEAKAQILVELQSPAFREEVWSVAKEFEREAFGRARDPLNLRPVETGAGSGASYGCGGVSAMRLETHPASSQIDVSGQDT